MRILMSFVGGRGHFEPLAPIARAAMAAGYDVAFACAPSSRPMVEDAGFAALAVGGEVRREPRRQPLRPLDREREERDLRERFVRGAARYRTPLLAALCRNWRPDVVVCDETDFGSMLAAEILGLPFAVVEVIGSGAFVRREVVGEALDELRAEHGLAPDPRVEMPSRYLVLSPFPRSYRAPDRPAPRTHHAYRPGSPLPRTSPAPSWSRVRPGAPTLYFTLGTVFHLESGDLFERVLAGLRELPVNLIATLGPEVDVSDFGAQPEHVHLERFLPQAQVLPYCDAVVSHGGSGSVLGALSHGLPALLIPLGADQPQNAERCASLGVAEVLDAMEVSGERVRAAAGRLLGDPLRRRNAERVRDEIVALPGVEHALSLLAKLGSQRGPVYSG